MSQNELDRQEQEKERLAKMRQERRDSGGPFAEDIECKSCGLFTPKRERFCIYCGEPPIYFRACITCRITAEPGWRYCKKCGGELTSGKKQTGHQSSDAVRDTARDAAATGCFGCFSVLLILAVVVVAIVSTLVAAIGGG